MATEEETIQLELMRQLEELNSLSVALPTKAQVGGQRGSASASLPPRRHPNHLRVLSSWVPTLLLALVVCVYTDKVHGVQFVQRSVFAHYESI